MGRRKEIHYINGGLSGKYLDKDTCTKLDMLRVLDRKNKGVPELKHMIADLNLDEVYTIIETKSNDFLSKIPEGTLSNLQTTGTAMMFFAKRCVLGDSTGIGKTVEVAALCNLLETLYYNEGKDFKFLYLTEKTLIPQTREKLIRFTGNYIQDLYGEKRYVQKFVDENYESLQYSVVGAHSLLTNDIFQTYLSSFYSDTGTCPFDLLIVDESGSVLANTKTKTYGDASVIAGYMDRIILLNATSFENNLSSFYAQLNFVDNTFLFSKYEFSKKYEILDYTGPYPMPSGKYRDADVFKEEVKYRYFARRRKNHGGVMVDCTAERIVVPLTKPQKALLKNVELKQMVYDCPSYFNAGVPTNTTTTKKLDALIKLIEGKLKDVKSILVYTQYRESQLAIYNELIEHGITDIMILNGASSMEEREDARVQFATGSIRILITNVQKGLDFDNCNHCIFYKYDTSSKMVQFEGRMTRSFNIVDKHVYVLLTAGEEERKFNKVIGDQARASDMFAGSDFSCVMSLFLNED